MTSLQIPLNISALSSYCDDLGKRRICFRFEFLQRINLSRRRIDRLHGNKFKLRAVSGKMFCFVGSNGREGICMREERQKKRVVLARVNQGFGFNGGGGGGDNGNTARLLGNLALAIGLTYLSMTGQLGWVLDAIVSIWLLAVLLPIVGLGAFLWWAGRDIVQDSCPNCGNGFQIFRSSLKDGLQLCPFCSQPFSVEGNEFVREPTKVSSNQSTTFGQAFSGFSPRSKTENGSVTVVDVEAEVKDVD
ncbi:uncharacterized protein LOC122648905 [Telopea speciosissima]|uniref:uncharacterized protein LOC122648905 n=1 Tax=Telopea speciosissima TaxID=54955 RepID=UPI001CC7F90D|nr:uncharacterized protein LOC122648905 [Telopea speciosissima]XP_043698145.1 uncharacterized protein LOC122648905 [Telopea speciosissima]